MDRVLEAVIAELASSGLARVSMDRIAARAGVSKTTVYTRWSSKNELLIAAYRRIAAPFPSIDTGSLRSDVDALWERYREGAANRTYTTALAGLIGAAPTDPQLREELHRHQAAWRSGLRELLARGLARGELSDDVDVDGLAELIQAVTVWRGVIGDLSVDEAFRRQIEGLVFATPPRRPG